MTDATREEAELGMKVYAAFTMTVKVVANALRHEMTDSDYEAVWQLLGRVAAGEDTLNVSPAEATPPEAHPLMKAGIQEAMSHTIRLERELANLIHRASGGFRIVG